MSLNLIQYAFVAGEISPTFLSRTDLEKYDFGLETAKNWFVDYQGGLSTRPGTRFREFIQHDDQFTRTAPFKFAESVANSYVMLFGNNYIRFLQEGQYVLEDAVAITSVSVANPGVVSATAHGYSTNDWVKIAGRTFQVGATTANTFALHDTTGATFNTSGQDDVLNADEVYRIYTVSSPYDSSRISALCIYQHLNDVYITSGSFAPAKLTRNDHTDWVLTFLNTSNVVPRPSVDPVASSAAAGSGACTMAVTSVDADGNESLPAYGASIDLTIFNSVGDSITVEWGKATGISKYNIYRSGVVSETAFTSGQAVGFIGTSHSLAFVDSNIQPDFTQTPPQGFDPFANGAISFIDVTNGGTGWLTYDTTVSITDPDGSGFIGFPVVGPSGAIEGVLIISGGERYSAPVVVFAGSGSGATATAELTEPSGNNPNLVSVFQQRGIFAGTPNKPLTIWGSIPGVFTDFSYSDVVVEGDSYEFTIESEEYSIVRHLIPSRGGLLMMTNSGVWILTGGNELAVTPLNVLADPQIYKGVSRVRPIPIDADILYVESKGSTVRLLSYNDVTKVYGGQSMSILANHLFGPEKQIINWSFAESPYSIVWGTRSDGALLAFTHVAEQKVFAWTHCWTQGYFKDVTCVQEGIEDQTYLTVERIMPDGTRRKFIESFAERKIEDVEDAWCLDCALDLEPTYPASTLTPSATSGVVTLTAGSGVFSSGDVGKIWRGGGGKGEVVGYVSSTVVSVDLVRDITNVVPETSSPALISSGDWTLDSKVSSVGGLWHLEGMSVMVLADGSVEGPYVVTGGSVSLASPASRVVVGLSYSCVARNLPMTAKDGVIEDKRKRIVGLGVRTLDTRGLELGRSLDKLRPMKERRTEPYGEPTRLQSDMRYHLVETGWDENGQMYFVQNNPLPATILGFVQDFEMGDDQE